MRGESTLNTYLPNDSFARFGFSARCRKLPAGSVRSPPFSDNGPWTEISDSECAASCLSPLRRFRIFRRLEPKNRFSFLHQIKSIARDRFQISWIGFEPGDFTRRSRQQQLLLIGLHLEAIELGQRCLLLFVKRNEQTDYHQPEREK